MWSFQTRLHNIGTYVVQSFDLTYCIFEFWDFSVVCSLDPSLEYEVITKVNSLLTDLEIQATGTEEVPENFQLL